MARQIVVSLVGDATKFSKAFDGELSKTESRIKKFSAGAKLAMAGVGLAVVAGVKSSISAASDLQQSLGGLDAVFGSSAAKVKAWGDESAKAVGLSKNQYATLAAVIGSQLNNMGRSQAQSASQTNDLIKLGADLAATYGGTAADAVSALSSVLKGETDPIERYGVSIKQSDINARLAAQGQSKLTGTALKTAQASAALALVSQQTAAAHGQWAAQTNTVAEKQQIMAAQVENIKAKLGDKLLPVVGKVTDGLTKMIDYIGKHKTTFEALAVSLGVVAGAVGVLTVAMWALSLTPVMLSIAGIVAGLAALAGGFYAAWKKSETFRKVVVAALNGTKDFVIGAVQSMANLVLGALDLIISGAAHAFGWIPGIGGKLKDANNAFDNFQAGVNRSLDAIQDRDIHINGDASGLIQAVRDATKAYNAAGFQGPALPTNFGVTGVHASTSATVGALTGGGTGGGGGGGGGAAAAVKKAAIPVGTAWVNGIKVGIDHGATTVKDALAKVIQAAKDQLQKAKDLAQQIKQAMTYTLNAMTMDPETGQRSKSLVADLQDQVAQAQKFVDTIHQLQAKGLNKSSLSKLVDAGPSSLGAAQELLNGGSGQIGQVNTLVKQLAAAQTSLADSEVKRRLGTDLTKSQPIKIQLELSQSESGLKATLKKIVKTEGGGNVQVAFGGK